MPITAAELVGLLGSGPNADVVATLGSDPKWNVAEDWGLDGWQAVRVPAGIKFQRAPRGLVCEEVLLVRADAKERAALTRLSAGARVPMHLLTLDRPTTPCHRLASLAMYLQGGRDE